MRRKDREVTDSQKNSRNYFIMPMLQTWIL